MTRAARYLLFVLDCVARLVCGRPVEIAPSKPARARRMPASSPVRAVAAPVKATTTKAPARPKVTPPRAVTVKGATAARPLPALPTRATTLEGMSFADALTTLVRSTPREREDLLATLPRHAPLAIALRYRLDDDVPSQPLLPGTVDPSTASAKELKTLPGIGRARANLIVAERERNGPFRSVEELRARLATIPRATLATVADQLVFSSDDEAA